MNKQKQIYITRQLLQTTQRTINQNTRQVLQTTQRTINQNTRQSSHAELK
jgi:hypothetical protein